jgi:quercetin dioxygenase-like cupin family protein
LILLYKSLKEKKMVEKLYPFTKTDKKCIEKLIDDDVAAINHIILPYKESVPDHDSNSNVYLIIVSGTMSATLNNQPTHEYSTGTILSIPFQTQMKISNQLEGSMLEFFIMKAPSPRLMK